MPQTLQALAEFTAARLIGDGSIEIAKVASIANARPGDLVFVESDRHLEEALGSGASAVIAGEFAAAHNHSLKASSAVATADTKRLRFGDPDGRNMLNRDPLKPVPTSSASVHVGGPFLAFARWRT